MSSPSNAPDSPSVVEVKPLVSPVSTMLSDTSASLPMLTGLVSVGLFLLLSFVLVPQPHTLPYFFFFSLDKLGGNCGPSNQHGFSKSSFTQPWSTLFATLAPDHCL